MKKSWYIVGALIIVIAACGGAYFYFIKSAKKTDQATVGAAQDVAQKAQSSLTDGVQSANPFSVNVNPYQGYKNPFK